MAKEIHLSVALPMGEYLSEEDDVCMALSELWAQIDEAADTSGMKRKIISEIAFHFACAHRLIEGIYTGELA